jgi:hypothetical protein
VLDETIKHYKNRRKTLYISAVDERFKAFDKVNQKKLLHYDFYFKYKKRLNLYLKKVLSSVSSFNLFLRIIKIKKSLEKSENIK